MGWVGWDIVGGIVGFGFTHLGSSFSYIGGERRRIASLLACGVWGDPGPWSGHQGEGSHEGQTIRMWVVLYGEWASFCPVSRSRHRISFSVSWFGEYSGLLRRSWEEWGV